MSSTTLEEVNVHSHKRLTTIQKEVEVKKLELELAVSISEVKFWDNCVKVIYFR